MAYFSFHHKCNYVYTCTTKTRDIIQAKNVLVTSMSHVTVHHMQSHYHTLLLFVAAHVSEKEHKFKARNLRIK